MKLCKYTVRKRGEYFYIYFDGKPTEGNIPHVTRKTANKYCRILETEYRQRS